MDNIKIPEHVGIIMDGNGRWATARGKERSYGHKKGSENVDRIVSYAFDKGVKTLTLYAFSSENWARPKEEVDVLMKLLKSYFKKFTKKAVKNGVHLKVIGGREQLSADLLKVIDQADQKTAENKELTLNLAVNYGGRQEVVRAVNKLLLEQKEITVDNISSQLDTANCGEPDLIIRTGGEYRLSNFLLWQAAYAEFCFTETLWPDLDEKEMDKIIDNFYSRKRRYGGI